MSAFGLPPSPPPGADVLYVWTLSGPTRVALCRLIIRPEDLKPRSERRRDAFNCTFGGRMNPNHEFLSELRPESFITVPEIILSFPAVFSLLLLRGVCPR